MEDIDAAFTRGISRDAGGSGEQNAGVPVPGAPPQPPQQQQQQGITLAGLLAAIDGVAAQEGRILFATTNDRAALDMALCRPGRLDVHFEFRLASKEQAEELFKHFYPAGQEYEGDLTPVSKVVDVVDEKVGLLVDVDVEEDYIDEKRDSAELSAEELSQLAKEFAALIPDEEFSMATLQGHLMQYKKRPRDVVKETPEWIKTERVAKRDWEEARRRRANPAAAATLGPNPAQDVKSNTAPTTVTNSPTSAENELQGPSVES